MTEGERGGGWLLRDGMYWQCAIRKAENLYWGETYHEQTAENKDFGGIDAVCVRLVSVLGAGGGEGERGVNGIFAR